MSPDAVPYADFRCTLAAGFFAAVSFAAFLPAMGKLRILKGTRESIMKAVIRRRPRHRSTQRKREAIAGRSRDLGGRLGALDRIH
jgi:hypothetical protein